MKKTENEKLNMLLAVSLVTNSNSLVWQNLPGFVNSFAKFTGYIKSARKANVIVEQRINGVAENKKQTRIEMKDVAMLVKGAVQAFASTTGNIQLFESVNFGKSKILKGKASSAHSRCQVIYNAADKVLSALSDFGVDATVMQNFADKIEEFRLAISAPRHAIANRIVSHEEFTKYLNLATETMNNEMTNLMENFRTTAPQFYAQFFENKRIIHTATNYTEIKADIINASTRSPLFGVLMTITSAEKTYTISSDIYGTADLRQMRPTLYNVTFSKPGFHSQTLQLNMRLSELKTLSIQLQPMS